MNILIIGGAGSLINQIIRKMKKEGHRVHLLTGNRYKSGTYEKVFERYDLPYDSECLTDVFESANPDVTLFMGAFDSNFRWENEQREMVRFTSGLTNFLMAHAMTGKGRFIFLSSDVVYSENYDTNIEEDVPTTPSSLKGMALSQGEELCASFKKFRETEIIVARLDHLYQIPEKPRDVGDIPSSMCLEAMQTGSISVNSGNRFSLLYDSDAVEFISQLICSEECMHSIYNLSSSVVVTEQEVAEYVQLGMRDDSDDSQEEKTVPIVENQAEHRRCILSNKRFDNEFGVKLFASTSLSVVKVVKYMTDHKDLFLSGEEEQKSFLQRFKERAGWLIAALIPYLENLIFFFLFFLLNSGAANSRYFSQLDFYLLYVLLFAVVHGQHQATFSAVLAVVGSFFSLARSQGVMAIALDYTMYIWIAQLFIVGLVVGYMKDRIYKMKMEGEEEREFLSLQLSDIKDINGSNVRVKDALETQIVNHSDSVGKIYSVTSKLETDSPEEVLFHAAEIVREFLGSKDIAIYTVSNNDYARLFAFTSDRAKVLGKSIRYRELGEVYHTLAERKVYINRELDEKYPMMASSIFNDEDQMQIIMMAWGIPWERMTLGQADLLTVVGYLIQNAVLRAARYINMLENRRYQENQYLMEQEAFSSLMRVFLDARGKQLTECVVLRLFPLEEENETIHQGETGLIPTDPLSAKNALERYEDAAKELTSKIRNSDYIGVLEDGNMYILLTNTTIEDAAYVMERVQGETYRCVLLEDFQL